MVSLIIWLVLGLVIGSLAKLFRLGREGDGVILLTILGVLGALVGGFMGGYVFGFPMVNSFENMSNNIPSFVSSIIGAIVVIAFYRFATGHNLPE